ncbi:MAG TPA: GNAT family N-acetyltransferase [Acetobacteraceae bacterium]|jgi:GNAT superfamily N-acetyltransferase
MIALTDDPDTRLEGVLEKGLTDYNEQMTGRRDWRALAVAINDPETGAPVGGLLGRTTLGLFFLDLFFLPEHLRRGGLGSQALRLAEEEAVRRGCRAAALVTIDFQAPEFYARNGWEEIGRVRSAADVERIFMRKIFAK